jgi:hypothetical protein
MPSRQTSGDSRIVGFIEALRRKLIDQSGRNSLLNFRPSSRSSIEIAHSGLDAIWDRLITQEASWKLAPWIVPDSTKAVESKGEKSARNPTRQLSLEEIEAMADNGYLAVQLDEANLRNNGTNIRRKAEAQIKEAGINNLYLAIGYLHWVESDDSSKERNSPLLLIPITLTHRMDQQGAIKNFIISYDEGDLEPNSSLKLVLESQFDIKLPFINEGESVTSYLARIQNLIEKKPRWGVKPAAHLGFFSFTKLRMYEDLDPAKWPSSNPLEKNELVQAILEGTERQEDQPRYGSVEVDDDHKQAHEIPLVIEADSSQHTAILKVQEGKHTVIEGPPGTGKSQTITNIIATSLAAGKTVLFVSEKLAALDVVWSNLNELGLSDFCLELHSNKARKDQLHQSISQRLRKKFQAPTNLVSLKNEWEASKDLLSTYVRTCSEQSGPKEAPLYSYFGRAVALREQDLPSLRSSFKKIPKNIESFNRVQEYLVQFASHIPNPSFFQDHPWSGFKPTQVSPGDDVEIFALFEELYSHIAKLGQIEEKLSRLSAIDHPLSRSLLETHEKGKLAPLFEGAKHLDKTLMAKFHDESTEGIALGAIQTKERFDVTRQAVLSVLSEEVANHPETIKELLTICKELEARSCSNINIRQLFEWIPSLSELGQVLESLTPCLSELQAIGIGPVSSISKVREIHPDIQLALSAPTDIATELEPSHAVHGVVEVLKKAKGASQGLLERRKALLQLIDFNDIPSTHDLRELKTTIRTTGGRFYSILNREYRAARNKILRFLKSPKLFRMPEIVELLENSHQLLEDERAFNEDPILKGSLGCRFKGTGTDWDRLEGICKWAASMSLKGYEFETISKIADGRIQDRLRRILEELEALLRRYDDSLKNCRPLVESLLNSNDPDDQGIEFLPGYIAGWSHWITGIASQLQACVNSKESTITEIRSAAEAAIKCQDINQGLDENQLFHERLAPCANGLQSDWHQIQSALTWNLEAKERIPSDLHRWILREDFHDRLSSIAEMLASACVENRAIEELKKKIGAYGEVEEKWLYGGSFRSWKELPDRSKELREIQRHLPQWVIYNTLLKQADAYGVQCLVDAVIRGEFPVDRMADVYDLTVCEIYGYKRMAAHDSLTTFTQLSHEGTRSRFGRRDKRLLELNREEVAARSSRRPVPMGVTRGAASEWSERALLEREIAKTKRHIPIRELMRRASRALLGLKPCVMMSPLSVAQYLDPSLPSFDLVVMDEASQIRPEDALGAIARGKQLVVVGDTKQMPPSRFYEAGDDDSDEEEEEISAAQNDESVLQCALHAFSPVYQLKWHYRSRHESLIRFSNHYYYDNELIIYPTAGRSGQRLGITFNFISDAEFVNRRNNKEAEAVAKAAIHHLMENPSESLLIATMNIPQQELIESWIDRITASDERARVAVEEARSREHEEFSVKNLENIQGHQRDVVMISMTYGKDPQSSRVMQRFGPITGKNGRRRLNVLFTRAKLRNEVFSSMTFQDINANPGNESGVNDLRNYLRYAKDGIMFEEGVPTGRPPDSDFEISVMNVVRSVGLIPVPQVGVASYRVDIGVSLPERQGEYILGIECDGATYHSSRSARDRDRLREEVLVSRGWKIYRVWSTDWFYQHEEAKKRLLQALKEATQTS